MEPDCAFYVGEKAKDYLAALVEGERRPDAFFERTAPDLVVEVEITSADEGRVERYGEMGVRELWRLRGRKGARELRADFLALGPGSVRACSMPRRCSKDSRRPMCARRWKGRGSA